MASGPQEGNTDKTTQGIWKVILYLALTIEQHESYLGDSIWVTK